MEKLIKLWKNGILSTKEVGLVIASRKNISYVEALEIMDKELNKISQHLYKKENLLKQLYSEK